MDDLQAGARLAGLSSLPRQAAGDAGRACLGIPPPVVGPLEAAFEDDLAGWLARLYAVRDERRLMGRLERTYGVGWLAVTAATLSAADQGPATEVRRVSRSLPDGQTPNGLAECAAIAERWGVAVQTRARPPGGLCRRAKLALQIQPTRYSPSQRLLSTRSWLRNGLRTRCRDNRSHMPRRPRPA